MNLKGFLNFLRLLIRHITKVSILLILLTFTSFGQQNINNTSEDSVFVMQKSPWQAVLMSAVVPGLGQIYNQSYIKAPIIWGVGVALYLGWKWNNDRYKTYQQLFYQNPGLTKYRNVRDFYRDQRDLFTIYMGIAYLLNLVDAYVDAQLFDFNVNENYYTKQPMLGIRVKLK